MHHNVYRPFVASEHSLEEDHPDTVILGTFEGYSTTSDGELRGMYALLRREFGPAIVVEHDIDGDGYLLGPAGNPALLARCDELYTRMASGDGTFDPFYREAEDEAMESWWDTAEIDQRIFLCRCAGASLALALADTVPPELDNTVREHVCQW